MIYILIGLAVCTVITVVMFKTAPPGWEDDNGFHRGVK